MMMEVVLARVEADVFAEVDVVAELDGREVEP
jgi:hypothetical protein